jgi:drug/metabolite transporter superfamily protein YnfA
MSTKASFWSRPRGPLAERQKPARWDVIGGAISLGGMALIVLGPRGK